MRVYGLFFGGMVMARIFLTPMAWQGNVTRHTVGEFAAALLALFIGLLALVRFHTRRDNVFLFIGTGFVGAGLLDFYHALAVNPFLTTMFSAVTFLPGWVWNASPTFLSILIFGSWLTWRREVETGWYGRMNSFRLFFLVASLTVTNVLLFVLVPFTINVAPFILARIELFISTTFYLWSLVSYLAKGYWQHDAFEHWLILALLLAFCRQAFFLFYSAQLFDAYFELAMGLKLVSYGLVLAGLIASIITIFRQAAQSTTALQQANQFLQQEIIERQRAEAAEFAQRQERNRLYEALQQRVEAMVTLHEISQAVISSLDLATILTVVTAQATRLLKVAATSVALVDQTAYEVWFAAASGEASDFVLGKRMALGQGIVGWVAQNGQPLLIGDAKTDQRHFPGFDQVSQFSARSVICVPLKLKGETLGAIEAMNKATGSFDDHDLWVLTLLAGPAAAAIGNAQLYEQARQEISERHQAEAALVAERALLARRITERTADLSAANAELARAARLKDEFLANMSHELRTPLNTILGMSEALQEEVYGSLNLKQAESLHNIEESGRHLLTLINDILDLSKIEVGKLSLDRGPVSVRELCQASLRLVRQAAHQKQLQVEENLDPSVSILEGDERRLKQILVNLLSNAVKFTPSGGRIGLDVQTNAERSRVEFSVWDTGIGIAAADMNRLFQPFVQLDSSLTREYNGTGLGLSLVYRMTRLHQGSVSLQSTLGQGSRFTVSLPWQEEIVPVNENEAFPQSLLPTLPLSGTILLAEDNEANIHTYASYLCAKGYQVVVARNGQEVLDTIPTILPDVILMDIQMPHTDGLQVIKHLRQGTDTASIPIIALTALAMPGDRERCLAMGAYEYLSKPVALKQLITTIERIRPQDRS